MGAFSIATAFMGTVIGAGFSSGQEIMQFFGDFGVQGVGGLLIAALGFFAYAALIMLLARRIRSDHYLDLLNPWGARWLNPVIDGALFGCSLGVQVVMVAGAGVLLEAELGIPSIIGSALLLLLNGFACWSGSEGVAKGFNISVPVLIVGSILVAGYAITNPPAAQRLGEAHLPNPMVGTWYTSAVLFVFHNMLSSIGVLAPMAANAKSAPRLLAGSLAGAFFLGLLGLTLVLCIVQNYALVQNTAMPMLAISNALSPATGVLYTVLMLCAIFSTTIGLTLSMGTRLKNAAWFRAAWYHKYILVMSAAALLCSRVGFVGLIGKLYPFFGYLSVLAFFCMAANLWKRRKWLR